MSTGAEGLEDLSRDLGKISAEVVPKVRGVVSKGALNIKNAMRADARKSQHFKPLAETIDYDMVSAAAFGSSVFAADIGPNKDRGGAASLAGIAYFGGSRGGGGTVRDPALALADEEPKFVEEILKLAGEGL